MSKSPCMSHLRVKLIHYLSTYRQYMPDVVYPKFLGDRAFSKILSNIKTNITSNLIDLFQTKIDNNSLESPEIMNIIDKLNEEYDLVVDENDYLNKQIETLSKYRRYIEDRHGREIYELKREHHIKPNPRPNYAVNS